MQKFRKLKIEHVQKMVVSHLLHYPAILVILKRLTGFPEEVWNPHKSDAELTRSVEYLVKGLTWKKPSGRR